ncbi:FtsX-like permease family protein [Draconibacterium sp. IB214405]|uniref:ABC transporter permease n=1 Tax=Draconibacterium sp. IB214405 TaxID=3097352 RepID=UPI002A10B5AC|nr:FtsX-like permease family protein [Draconibacterium sp. IB214405]MDX8337727.1 FtsX-like permease family protein [Draconibacterium sp. IB214405]
MYNLKITIRRLFKDKAFSLINISGLVIGISSFLVLFIHVSNEKSFDKHFAGHQNIYRVTSVPGGLENTAWARSMGIVYAASEEIPEVELATQFSHCDEGTIKMGETSIAQKNIMSVDEAFMELFEVEPVVGDLAEISKPNTVFITEDFARKYYGNLNPVGQTITIEALQYSRDLGDYEIRGVVKNTHPKTHFRYELLLSQKGGLQERFESLPNRKIQWTYNYFKLQKDTDPKLVAEKVTAFYDNSSLKTTPGPQEYGFALFPMDNIHLKSDYRFELRESSSKINIGLFILISFVILTISLLNFTNLSIAKLIKRSKELGLKKSIGATKSQLIKQVLMEVILVCLMAISISLLTIEGLKPVINRLFEIEFDIYFSEPVVYLTIIGVLLTCLLLSAFFVAIFLLARSSAIDILAGRNNFSGSYVLKSLLVVQVTIVIVLISGTFLVNKQIDFVLNKPLGFDKENVVVLHLTDLSKDPAVFARELEKQSQVVSVGMTAQHFGYPAQAYDLEGLGLDGNAEFVFANYDYLKTMNIKLIQNWIKPDADTVRGMVINNHLYQRLMEKHGSMENLLAYSNAQPLGPGETRINYIGVAEDFNYSSAHESIGDYMFWLDEGGNRARFTHIRINNVYAGMEAIKRTWNEYYPNQELDYFFIDEKIAQQYKAETILSRILFAFSTIGILISIIGISALALFISQQRTKEIGIRKVNGATVSEILGLLNQSFVKWVLIAFVIATPLSFYTMSKWLENFAYKTNMSWWIFALAGALALVFALITVTWHSWRAATRNPVESLRYE